MPKIVDHDAQRMLFARAAIRLIARNGLEGITMRAVAAESGLSYGSLFHYFESKDDLLMYAVRYLTTQQTRRVNEYSIRYKGLKALGQLLYDDVLVEESSRDEAVVWLAFLYKAAVEEPFAELYSQLIDGWLDRFKLLLGEARDNGEIRQDMDTDLEAMAVWVYSAGIGEQGLLHPAMFPPRVQKKLITAYLDKLRS
jgi:AcrR family transcriptional regulator